MDHFEALQRVLNQYKRGLMTTEEYAEQVYLEIVKDDKTDKEVEADLDAAIAQNTWTIQA